MSIVTKTKTKYELIFIFEKFLSSYMSVTDDIMKTKHCLAIKMRVTGIHLYIKIILSI